MGACGMDAIYAASANVTSLADFPKKESFFIHCAGGYRSVIALSILKSRGIHNAVDIKGGYGAIKNTSLKRTESSCSAHK